MKVVFQGNISADDYQKMTKKAIQKIIIFMVIICLCLVLYGWYVLSNDLESSFGLFLIVFGIVMPIVMFFALNNNMKKQVKTNKAYFNNSIHAVFEDNNFIIITKGQYLKSTLEAQYDVIYKAQRQDNLLTIFTSNQTLFQINFDHLIEGNIEDLTHKLKDVLDKMYHDRKLKRAK